MSECKEIGLTEEKSNWECGLPAFLQESLDKIKKTWEILDSGKEYSLWDCDCCELQSNINIAEVEKIISEDQAWYLREKYLRLNRSECQGAPFVESLFELKNKR